MRDAAESVPRRFALGVFLRSLAYSAESRRLGGNSAIVSNWVFASSLRHNAKISTVMLLVRSAAPSQDRGTFSQREHPRRGASLIASRALNFLGLDHFANLTAMSAD